MRLAICTIGTVYSLYIVMAAAIIAKSGAIHGIPQLTAAGGAEFALGMIGIVASLCMFWKPAVGVALFLCATAFSCVIGLIYEDEIVWTWAIIYVLFTVASWFYRSRMTRRALG